MLCKLCQVREANKSNTHYLTDAIIRSCLNQGGTQEREKGFYFDLSGSTPFSEFNFQRGTSVEKLKEALGRDLTDEEILNAKKIPFSVDYFFCSECEAIFTVIETDFIQNILPLLRGVDLANLKELQFKQIKIFRLFFLIQIWRTATCVKYFEISDYSHEKIRRFILHYDEVSEDELKQFPLSIAYLETLGGDTEFTRNFVGYTSDKNPHIILMNDFVIQFYESKEHIAFNELYGLNDAKTFDKFINYNEEAFAVKILNDEERKAFYSCFLEAEKVNYVIPFLIDKFKETWIGIFGVRPTIGLINQYIDYIINGNKYNILKYSMEDILERTSKFILYYLNK